MYSNWENTGYKNDKRKLMSYINFSRLEEEEDIDEHIDSGMELRSL